MSIPKFRAWHKELKIMKNVEAISFGIDPGVLVRENENLLSTTQLWCLFETELMQWTGMQDKNGVDIYEGSILILGGADNFFVEKIKCVYFLSFKVMKVQQGWIQHRKLMGDFCEKEFEVVGNIYQNQELLNANT